MKVVRRWYWLISGLFKKHFFVIITSIVVGSIAVTQFPLLLKFLPSKSVIHVGRVGLYTLNTLPADIQQQVSLGLTSVSPDNQYALAAAQDLEVSSDGTEYTFTLNPSITWPDGQTLSSADINYTIADVEVERPNQQQIVFKLKEPFSPFPVIVSQPILKKVTSRFGVNKTSIVGLRQGQIKNIQFVQDYVHKLTLETENQIFHYSFYPTEADAVTAFKLGSIDSIEYLNTPYLPDWQNITTQTINLSNRYLGIFFNTADQNLQEKTIRQLLTYAIPKDTSKNRVVSPISRRSWAYNPVVKPYDYNLETAKSMVQKLKETNSNFTLDLELTTTPTYAGIGQIIVDSWQSLGFNVKLTIVPYPDTNDYQILLIGQQIPDDPDQYALWHSTQRTNITKYQNPKIDKLLEDGRKETDREKRSVIYQDFQRFLLEDCPAAFLYELPFYTLSRV